MGEIRPKKCEGRELTKDQLAAEISLMRTLPTPVVTINFCVQALTRTNGPIRQCVQLLPQTRMRGGSELFGEKKKNRWPQYTHAAWAMPCAA